MLAVLSSQLCRRELDMSLLDSLWSSSERFRNSSNCSSCCVMTSSNRLSSCCLWEDFVGIPNGEKVQMVLWQFQFNHSAYLFVGVVESLLKIRNVLLQRLQLGLIMFSQLGQCLLLFLLNEALKGVYGVNYFKRNILRCEFEGRTWDEKPFVHTKEPVMYRLRLG